MRFGIEVTDVIYKKMSSIALRDKYNPRHRTTWGLKLAQIPLLAWKRPLRNHPV